MKKTISEMTMQEVIKNYRQYDEDDKNHIKPLTKRENSRVEELHAAYEDGVKWAQKTANSDCWYPTTMEDLKIYIQRDIEGYTARFIGEAAELINRMPQETSIDPVDFVNELLEKTLFPGREARA